ncbi:hypothetical protein NPIL_153251 [Nephila pilipes]|uniref:Uncharacterized protein n=1 Tax=Nephila pilipes TaxID=299642 RepID=A0A8X6P9H0_NEPPI|nr:hypothetical protein NPIL_153251 [Nephila pilipes]
MPEDLNDQLIAKIEGKKFLLQLADSVDNNNYAPLTIYVRLLDGNCSVRHLHYKKGTWSKSGYYSQLQLLFGRKDPVLLLISCTIHRGLLAWNYLNLTIN